jgi:predicted O-methyltransferase YrrM
MEMMVEYRMSDLRNKMGKISGTTSMLHPDVLLLIYHFAKIASGHVLEIGAFVGGSTIAAAMGIRDSGTNKKLITVEPGGQLKGHRMATRNIFKDLTKNLSRYGVAQYVKALNGYSFDPAVVAAIRAEYKAGDVGFFTFDADDNVRRDLDLYGDLLADGCWVVIDDYVGTAEKAAPTHKYVDEFVEAGKLVPLGYYGWSTWVGRWRA